MPTPKFHEKGTTSVPIEPAFRLLGEYRATLDDKEYRLFHLSMGDGSTILKARGKPIKVVGIALELDKPGTSPAHKHLEDLNKVPLALSKVVLKHSSGKPKMNCLRVEGLGDFFLELDMS